MSSLSAVPQHSRSSAPTHLAAVASRPRPSSDEDLAALVHAARAGDARAWTRLVERFDPTLRRIARSYRLAPADVDDAVQTTWLELVERIAVVREPAAIAGWLATVTRRNALRGRQRATREQLTDDPDAGSRQDADGPEERVLEAERRDVLASAIGALPERNRRLVTVLLAQPELDYRRLGTQLSMPPGSIGPSRARAFAQLARDPHLRAVSGLAAA